MKGRHRILESSLLAVEHVLVAPAKHSVKTLAAELKLSPSTCYRIVNTLIDFGWLQQTEEGALRAAWGLYSRVLPNFEHANMIEEIRPEMVQ